MECNREQALKAQNLAEAKILSQDFFQAQRLIHSAEHLYPDLPGLAQMRAIVDIECSCASLQTPQKDPSPLWCKIFQVKHCTDNNAIKKHYRKLLLLLHPDKNKYPGAASAFKLLINVWNDYLEYIQEGEVFTKNEDNYNNEVSDSCEVFRTVSTPKTSPFSVIMCKNPSEHWEYFQVDHASNNVSCMLCIHPSKRGRPHRNTRRKHTSKSVSTDSHDDNAASKHIAVGINFEDMQKSRDSSLRKQSGEGANVETFNKLHQEFTKAESCDDGKEDTKYSNPNRSKDSLKEVKVSATISENNMKMRGNLSEDTTFSLQADSKWSSHGPRSRRKRKAVNIPSSEPKCKSKASGLQGTNISREGDANIEQKFFRRVRSYILHGLQRINASDINITQRQIRDQRNGMAKESGVVHLTLGIKFTVPSSRKPANAPNTETSLSSMQCKEEAATKVHSKASSSDVYDFNKSRQEECFQPGQIWALYDDIDKLPRYYARVAEVLSKHPFKIHMKRLYPSRSISDCMKLWIDSGLAYTCGEYRVGRVLTRRSTSSFSHVVKCERTKGPIRIYPRKGDVWALYKVWKPIKGATHECEPVEVMSEYSEDAEDSAIKVAPLFRVKGFKSIFCRAESELCEFIPKAELTRFSHQVPAHHLQGDEAPSLPNNCLDLDTVALFLD